MENQNVLILFVYIFFCSMLTFTKEEILSITTNQSTMQYNETLVSTEGTFEAGFFNFGNSTRQYFGIWYKNMLPRTIVWVANRDAPTQNKTAILKLTDQGNLVIIDGSGGRIWSSGSSGITVKPIVQLLDSGNLVVKDGDSTENLLWESFDYPSDTLLAGMKLKSNLVTGPYKYLTSWRDSDDPAEGSSNGYLFAGVSREIVHRFLNFSLELTEKEVSYEYETSNSSIFTILRLNPAGRAERFLRSDGTKSWEIISSRPLDQCEYYAYCGVNSNCNANHFPVCECLQGFRPKFQAKWDSSDWSGGCVRRISLNCHNGVGFQKYTGMKLPDMSSSWFNRSLRPEECETLCLKNCSCTAYANLDVRGAGSGCLLWFDNIVDMGTHTERGQDHKINKRNLNKKKLAGILVGIITFIIGLTILGKATKAIIQREKKTGIINRIISRQDKSLKEDMDLSTIFDFSTISDATNHFSDGNKLGKGGFGPVYKGVMANGREIAVKRLSKTSRQGIEEFKNEVMLMATLQHRNLVKPIGCSIQQDEKLLIYEFMPNGSLDYFIFDSMQSKLLDWSRRFQIIDGIARGLLYLHQDSRLRIIHRDIKASNILLDNDMNPKISDFGLARSFKGDQIEANTNRVMGTYGYISPEYALHGSFSVKSDVFSFGVIVLEIISGRKNQDFCDPDNYLNLLGHAWRL